MLVAFHSAGEARLWPGPEIDAPGVTPERDGRRDRLHPSLDLRRLVSTRAWRCQATCDETGHIRQGCLMLEDPRLSGLAHRLDHLSLKHRSQARSGTKSLSDLGLTGPESRPTC
ncbi:hypothetical protein [Phaeobacter sp. B1627]|uniref:hypothetical protein n=1 Tax=Phaeobacter sp. B1627 TaxID=2583809 RepID=UPI00159EF018|nr:hypothetical protein [Phaeobacter sp. B1627]